MIRAGMPPPAARPSPAGTRRRRLLGLIGVAAVLSACTPTTTTPASGSPPFSTTVPASAATTTATSIAKSPSGKVETFAAAVVGRMASGDGEGQGLTRNTGSLLESTNTAGSGGIRELDDPSGTPRVRVVDQPGRTVSGVAVSARPNRPSIVWQLTLRDHVAIARDPSTLGEQRQVTFQGEGWGLCDDGTQLVHSNGTMRLMLRDADTFEEKSVIEVTGGWWTTGRLGELECVGTDGRREVWANLAGTSWMLRVDLAARAVTAVADLAPVMAAATSATPGDAITGIAAIPNTRNEFWISGKSWRTPIRVRLTPRP
ncbi:glutamine cyclotransferase [Lentzea atacamensis]|uniref:Glutamine cyclotransferase n=1 Tax=Lentzea atacamensis TaxID=531938 RepID=A0ABX9DZ95_9PSEU|nr:glutaminyl-peptide cyclotransferase [Lentzea atacamensis]RAS59436.1 glutamine cyclotransferase [Lentzea atacamensis]